MTPHEQAQALVKQLSVFGIVGHRQYEEGVKLIADVLRTSRPIWTDERPTEIGEYQWRLSPADDRHVVTVFPGSFIAKEQDGLCCAHYRQYRQGTPVAQWDGQWAKIELPEEP